VAKKTLKERFDAKVKVNSQSDCWIWTGTKDRDGYGLISVDGKPKRSMRVVYELYRGPIPKDLVLDHCLYPGQCIGPSCCNPQHLVPTTRSANSARNSWTRKTHCPAGHEYTPENTVLENTRGGRKSRRCKKCKHEHIKQWQLRNRERVKGYKAKRKLRTKLGRQVGSVPAGDTKAA
jgi:hypothetical protein